ncbi:hypothetical protein TNCT_353321 [Trichonephila clavata]|uniref:Uncharacterized protein n=1 Tax=Trichonephila clavata TaxID=2740835 RepID=A0A8X6FYM6_TRICU|nr:hypothetical protein TNCT_353321 [Trichonephila clavata]
MSTIIGKNVFLNLEVQTIMELFHIHGHGRARYKDLIANRHICIISLRSLTYGFFPNALPIRFRAISLKQSPRTWQHDRSPIMNNVILPFLMSMLLGRTIDLTTYTISGTNVYDDADYDETIIGPSKPIQSNSNDHPL